MIVHTYVGDCAEIPLPDNAVDLVLTSPMYETGQRRYRGLEDFDLHGEDWVRWAIPRFEECLRVSRGLVAWVVGGRVNRGQWSAVPDLLSADLHRRGVRLYPPAYYVRRGTPGSGGRWLRNDAEKILCASKGDLPWSDNCAMGTAPKFTPTADMFRRRLPKIRRPDATDFARWGNARAERMRQRGDPSYRQPSVPARVNPGNLLSFGRGDSWGAGSRYAHQTEAPFPEWLARFFIVSFCPPGGVALDPMCGSGTVGAVAVKEGRQAVLGDIRPSQIRLATERIQTETDGVVVCAQSYVRIRRLP